MADNTFLGLQPYTEDDTYRFKGRTEESQDLFRLIVRNEFTVCYAESGEGKTSLLNAGVFPLLRENMFFPIAITFTSDDYKVTPESFDTIIDRCIKDSITEYNEKNKGVNVEYRLCSADFQGLGCQSQLQQELSKCSWWKLRNYKPQAMGLTFTSVFVFDQFEEVFNQPGSVVWTKKFFDWLEDVSSDSCSDEIAKTVRAIIGDKAAFPTIKEEKGFKAVFSLRKEFIGELDYWGMQTHFIPALKDNRYCLKPLSYDGAKKVMAQQERFDEDKVEQIITYFVGQYSREPEKTIKENLPAIPALLLSVVCDSLEKDMDAFAELSTVEIGQSLNTILERFYNQTIDAIEQELQEQYPGTNPEQCRYDLDTAVFALVDSNGKRVRTKTTNASLTQIDFDAKYKQTLGRHRIIKVTKVDGEDYVEIVHDSLCLVIFKRKEQRRLDEEQAKAIVIQDRVVKVRKRNRLYANLFCLFVGIVAIVLTIMTTWTSSTGLKGCLTSIKHDGIWTYEDMKKYRNMALTDSLIIDDKGAVGEMALNNNLALMRAYYNVDSIGLKVEKCENLQEIMLGDDVHKASIDIDASCKSLTRIYIGKEVSQLSICIGAMNLDSLIIDVSPQNKNYKWDYCFAKEKGINEKAGIGLLWDRRNGEIVYMGIHEESAIPTNMQFPDELIQLQNSSFIHYKTKNFANTTVDATTYKAYSGALIESYSLKDGEKDIGEEAFSECKNLKSVEGFPERIGLAAFLDCEKLEKIQLDSVSRVAHLAFDNCHSLREINLSNNYGTEKLDSVELSAFSFRRCLNLRTVKFPKVLMLSPYYYHLRTFENCIRLEEVFLPDTVKVYDNEKKTWTEDKVECIATLFANCPNISKVHISSQSLFRKDTLSGIVYYKDIPVICNMANNYEWMDYDTLHYFIDGFLYTSIDDGIVHIDTERNRKYPNWDKFIGNLFYNSGDSLIYMFPDTTEPVVYLPYVKKIKGVGVTFPFLANMKELHTPYAEPRMFYFDAKRIDMFVNMKDVILYVPWGTKHLYEKDFRFKEFKEIREDSIWWRMFLTIHYAFNRMLDEPWKFFLLVLMFFPIFSMSKERIKKEKEKYNITLKYKDALVSSFCSAFAIWTIVYLFIFYVDYHFLSLS